MPNRSVDENDRPALEDTHGHVASLLPRQVQREQLLEMSRQRAHDPDFVPFLVVPLHRDLSDNAQQAIPRSREQIPCVATRSAHPEPCMFENRSHRTYSNGCTGESDSAKPFAGVRLSKIG